VHLKRHLWAGGVAKWYRTCLAFLRPGLDPQHSENIKQILKRDIFLFEHLNLSIVHLKSGSHQGLFCNNVFEFGKNRDMAI
jgi:hypothetical protein